MFPDSPDATLHLKFDQEHWKQIVSVELKYSNSLKEKASINFWKSK